jgi:hypothetical protein
MENDRGKIMSDEDAVAFIRVIGEEFASAGFPCGDRSVILENIRSVLKPMPDEASLRNPNFVHINMLRGGIAKPTWEQIKHLYPEQFANTAVTPHERLKKND